MGPQGTGFLYGKREQLERLRPLQIGSRAANVIDELSFEPLPSPHRFEAGILNTSGVLGLAAAVGYIEEIGLPTIRSRLKNLSQLLTSELDSIPKLELYGPQDIEAQAGIVSWNLRGMDPHQVAKKLDQVADVIVASGAQGSRLVMRQLGVEGVIRSSVHVFNTEADVYRLVEAIDHLIRATDV
jgi:cysteine desulfurase/selenocysteine lyase